MKRESKGNLCLLPVLLCLLLGFFLTEQGSRSIPAKDYEAKLAAAKLSARCQRAIAAYREELGLPMNESADVNRTGLIGPDYSWITTTLGNLEAKRTSTNPNMAAIFVDMFTSIGCQEGDCVAVNCSASFPALNIAGLAAMETLGLCPVVMSSFGASTHGANDPELTWQDMEDHLYELGLLATKSRFFSVGGNLDIGTEMPEAVKREAIARLEEKGYSLWYEEDIRENIQKRYDYYQSQGDVKCFVNIGGNDVSFGNDLAMVQAKGGILTSLTDHDKTQGLVQMFLRDHVPVIHFLNIKSLANSYGLPIDPCPLPRPGVGAVYEEKSYPRIIPLLSLSLAIAILLLRRRLLRENHSR